MHAYQNFSGSMSCPLSYSQAVGIPTSPIQVSRPIHAYDVPSSTSVHPKVKKRREKKRLVHTSQSETTNSPHVCRPCAHKTHRACRQGSLSLVPTGNTGRLPARVVISGGKLCLLAGREKTCRRLSRLSCHSVTVSCARLASASAPTSHPGENCAIVWRVCPVVVEEGDARATHPLALLLEHGDFTVRHEAPTGITTRYWGRDAPRLFAHGGTQITVCQRVWANWCASSASRTFSGCGTSSHEVVCALERRRRLEVSYHSVGVSVRPNDTAGRVVRGSTARIRANGADCVSRTWLRPVQALVRLRIVKNGRVQMSEMFSGKASLPDNSYA